MNLLEIYQSMPESINLTYNKDLGLYTAKYLHAGVNFSNPYIAMARGLTFTEDGTIVLRGFNKFFNYKQLNNESYERMYTKEWIKIHSDLALEDPNHKYTAIEKMDGSLVLLGVYQGNLITASTSSTTSFVTERANAYFRKEYEDSDWLLKTLEKTNLTLLFEWTSPTNQVGVFYPSEKFTLIGAVDNKSGEPATQDELDSIAYAWDFPRPRVWKKTLAELIADQENLEDFEGYVVVNEWGNLIKFKTEEWFNLSKTHNLFFGKKLTKRKVRTILHAYANDELDDLIAREEQHELYKDQGFIKQVMVHVEDIEKLVKNIQLKEPKSNWSNPQYMYTNYHNVLASIFTNYIRHGLSIWRTSETQKATVAENEVLRRLGFQKK